jgi:hypothetical protein
VIIRAPGQSNEYFLAVATREGEPPGPPVRIALEATNRSLAGSDFRLMDFGLEFLYWPDQRLLKPEMRRGRSCRVLQSINPRDLPGSYARLVSWIDLETDGLLRAERMITGGELSLPLDDSFIYLQYARAIAQGHPFVYTAGNAPTSGATSLLWPFLLLPPHLTPLGPTFAIAWSLALGVLALLASTLLIARLGRSLGGGLGMILSVLFFLASPHLLWGYMSGMEIGLYASVLLGTVWLYLREREAARFPRLRQASTRARRFGLPPLVSIIGLKVEPTSCAVRQSGRIPARCSVSARIFDPVRSGAPRVGFP